jgi:hypothetical protein
MTLAVERAPKPTDDCLSGLAIFMNAVLLVALTPVRARSQAAAICANSYFWSATRFLSGLTLIKRKFRAWNSPEQWINSSRACSTNLSDESQT